MRLLRCLECKTIEPLPDPPKGVDPQNIHDGEDPLLDALVAKHQTNNVPHVGQLHHVEDADWNNADHNKREEIRREILERLGAKTTGLGDDMYALRDTFHEDALNCFRQHHRPERCIDWKEDSKKLGRPTKEGQRFQREFFKAPTVYLCDFCPVASKVTSLQNEAKGLTK